MKFAKEHALLIAAEIPGQTWQCELSWLYSLTENSTRHLEIGTYAGRSLFVASHGMSTGEIYTVDSRKENDRGIPLRFLKEQTLVSISHCYEEIKIHQLEASSFEAAKIIEGNFDSIFIDGDHEYESVMIDILTWLPRLNAGGTICGHDYWPNHWGVMEAVNHAFGGKHITIPDTRIWAYKND
jgi:predicted O-methyltransferase YrrM